MVLQGLFVSLAAARGRGVCRHPGAVGKGTSVFRISLYGLLFACPWRNNFVFLPSCAFACLLSPVAMVVVGVRGLTVRLFASVDVQGG